MPASLNDQDRRRPTSPKVRKGFSTGAADTVQKDSGKQNGHVQHLLSLLQSCKARDKKNANKENDPKVSGKPGWYDVLLNKLSKAASNETKLQSLIGPCYMNVGIAYFNQTLYREALGIFDQAFITCQEGKDELRAHKALHYRAKSACYVASECNDLTKSQEFIVSAIENLKSLARWLHTQRGEKDPRKVAELCELNANVEYELAIAFADLGRCKREQTFTADISITDKSNVGISNLWRSLQWCSKVVLKCKKSQQQGEISAASVKRLKSIFDLLIKSSETFQLLDYIPQQVAVLKLASIASEMMEEASVLSPVVQLMMAQAYCGSGFTQRGLSHVKNAHNRMKDARDEHDSAELKHWRDRGVVSRALINSSVAMENPKAFEIQKRLVDITLRKASSADDLVLTAEACHALSALHVPHDLVEASFHASACLDIWKGVFARFSRPETTNATSPDEALTQGNESERSNKSRILSSIQAGSLSQSLELVSYSRCVVGFVRCLEQLGSVHQLQGIPLKAQYFFDMAVQVARQAGSARLVCRLLLPLSKLECTRHFLDKSLDRLEEARALLPSTPPPTSQASVPAWSFVTTSITSVVTELNHGELLVREGKLEEALQKWAAAESFIDKLIRPSMVETMSRFEDVFISGKGEFGESAVTQQDGSTTEDEGDAFSLFADQVENIGWDKEDSKSGCFGELAGLIGRVRSNKVSTSLQAISVLAKSVDPSLESGRVSEAFGTLDECLSNLQVVSRLFTHRRDSAEQALSHYLTGQALLAQIEDKDSHPSDPFESSWSLMTEEAEDMSLLDKARETLGLAFESTLLLQMPRLTKDISRALAEVCGRRHPLWTTFALDASFAISARHQLLSTIRERVGKQHTERSNDSRKDCSEADHASKEVEMIDAIFRRQSTPSEDLDTFSQRLRLLPENWTVCLVTTSNTGDKLIISQLTRAGETVEPTVLRLSLPSSVEDGEDSMTQNTSTSAASDNRGARRQARETADGTTRHKTKAKEEKQPTSRGLSFQLALQKFKSIMQRSKATLEKAKTIKSVKDKKKWWDTRYALDEELGELLASIEEQWFGAWKGVLQGCHCSETRVKAKAQQDGLAQILSTYSGDFPVLSSAEGRKAVALLLRGAQSGRVTSEQLVRGLEWATGHPVEGHPQMRSTQQNNARLRHFADDILELAGISSTAISFTHATAATTTDHTKQGCSTRRGKSNRKVAEAKTEQEKNADCHSSRGPLILVLSKELQQLPWESLPILQDHPVCRVPSLSFLFYHLVVDSSMSSPSVPESSLSAAMSSLSLESSASSDTSKQPQRSNRSTRGRKKQLEKQDCKQDPPESVRSKADASNAFYIVNPGKDLTGTERIFGPALTQVGQWRGIVAETPSQEDFSKGLTVSLAFWTHNNPL